MRNIRILIFFFLFSIPIIQSGNAQDSLYVNVSDTLRTDIIDTYIANRHSPTRAAILSAVFPGMGQLYNKKYWKLPLIYGGMGTVGYYIIHFNKLYQQYQNAYVRYNKYGKTDVLVDLPRFNMDWDINRQLVFYKDNYRRYRDLNVLIMGGIYVLNIIDATVDAYLFNYDISNKISLHIEPTMINNYASLTAPGLKFSFTFR